MWGWSKALLKVVGLGMKRVQMRVEQRERSWEVMKDHMMVRN